jgi:tetratricopeptide (TPR) repeat protein
MSENFTEDEVNGESLLSTAMRVAETVGNLDGYSELASLIAIRYAEAGLLDMAVDLADTIEDPYSREQLLASIAAKCVEFGEDEYAGELLQMIEDPGLYSVATEQMAVKYAEAGAFDRAIEITREMDDSGQTLSKIALIQADGGLFAEALELARSVEDPILKAIALTELAARNLRQNRKAEGAELLPEATAAARKIEFTQDHINILVEIASLYRESEQEEQALQILSRASRLADEFEDERDVSVAQDTRKDDMLATVAAGFARLHHYDKAEPVIEKLEDPFKFSEAAAHLALEYHKAGQSGQALNLLKEALEVVQGEEVYGERGLTLRDNLLAELAVAYSVIGRYEEALQIAEAISSLNLRHSALKEVAKTGVSAGNHDVVFRVAGMAQEPYAKVLYHIEISDALTESGQMELSDRALSQALEGAEILESAFEKALALMEIAVRYAQREQTAKATDLLSQALNTAALIGDEYHKARALIALDDRYRKAGLEPGEREMKVLQEIDAQTGEQN